MFTDSHAHLDPHYYDEPVDAVLARAAEAGVSRIVVVGCGLAASEHAIGLAERHPGRLLAAVGVHPHEAASTSQEDMARIERLAKLPEVAAIGESGLDYHYDRSPRDTQREVFEYSIELAKSLNKPLIVHTREAEEDTMRILARAAPLPASGVLHCFSGTIELARFAIELGMYVSFSGVVTFNNADRLRGCARELPLDRLLIETDCPYMTPAPFRGMKNEPMFVPAVASAIASAKGLSVEEVAVATGRSAARLFRAPDPSPLEPFCFAAGTDLHVFVHHPDETRVMEALERYPAKKIKRIVLRSPEGASPCPSALEAVRGFAKGKGKPVVE